MKQFIETATALTHVKGNRWKIVLAVPGKGNTATYSADVLREQGPIAVHNGAKGYITHKLPQDRDPRDQFARYENVHYEDDLDLEKYPEGALVADMVVKSQYVEMIEELGEDAEFSMFILDGDTDEHGNALTMKPHRANTVDLVSYGGLEGTGLVKMLTESFSLPEKTNDRTSASDKNESKVKMDQETKDAIAAAVAAAVAPLQTALTTLTTGATAEAIAQAKAEGEQSATADVQAKVDEALAEYDGKLELIAAAPELTSAQVESLTVEARKGTDIAPLIESYKKLVADVTKSLVEGFEAKGIPVRVNESGADATDFRISGWGA